MNSATVKIILSVSTPDQDEEISLVGQEFIFGRSPDSTVVLNDPNFSRTHFKIYVHERKLWIADAGSSNGTFVNGERLGPKRPMELEEGESITVPNSKIQLSLVETNYQSGLESTDIFEIPAEFHEDDIEVELEEEDEEVEEASPVEEFSHLSDKIYEAANLKIEHIIFEANAKSRAMIEATEEEIEKRRIEAFEESDNLIKEKQNAADLEIEKFKAETKERIDREFQDEKQSQIDQLKTGIATDRKILLKKLDDEAQQVAKENEKKKNEFIQSLNKLEGLINTKKEEYVNLDIIFEEKLEKSNEEFEEKILNRKKDLEKMDQSFEEKLKKANEDFNEKIAAKKKDLEKMDLAFEDKLKKSNEDFNEKIASKKKDLERIEKNFQEEKEKLIIQVEKETVDRRNELQTVIDEYKEKIKAKERELQTFEKDATLKQQKIVEELEMDTQFKREEFLLALSELENKILSRKNDIHKLEVALENQKANQFKILEAQVESKKIELEEELQGQEEKIAAAQKEFGALFEQYEKKKGEQAQTLDQLKKERDQIQKEIKDLSVIVEKDRKVTAEEVEVNKNAVASMRTETEKFKKSKLDAEALFQKAAQEYAELQKNIAEIKKNIANEESQLKQKKQSLQSVEAETKKMFAQKDEILPKITAMNAEFAELNKKLQTANHAAANIDLEHAKKIEVLKTAFLQKKTDLDEEIRKLKDAEEKRVQNLASQEMARINKIKEDSLRMVLELEDSITKELSNSTSKVFANTIGMEKFREILPNYDKSIRTSLQAGVLKLLTNELATPNPNKATKTLSSKQKMWKPMATSALVSALIFGLIPYIYRQVQDLNDPVRKRMEEEARIAAIVPPKKFTPEKVSTLGSNFVNSVIYTEGFCDVYAKEDFRSELMKKGSVYLYKQWQIDEEKSIQSYAMIFSMIDLLKEKVTKIDPDNEKRDIDKLNVIEKDTMKKLEKILGNEVRLEAAMKFQTRFYQDYVARGGASN